MQLPNSLSFCMYIYKNKYFPKSDWYQFTITFGEFNEPYLYINGKKINASKCCEIMFHFNKQWSDKEVKSIYKLIKSNLDKQLLYTYNDKVIEET
jgi:hypothetical protein